jgi:HemK-related putative methylase
MKSKPITTATRASFPSSDLKPFLGKVYKPDDDSYLLVDSIIQESEFINDKIKPSNALEIGMGSGVAITTAAMALKGSCKFYATDINPDALEATKKCAQLNNVEGLELVLTNLADHFKNKLKNKVDLFISNPPFEPAPVEDIGHKSVKCAWAAGPTGRAIIDKILTELPNLMSDKGVIYMAMIAENNVPEIIDIMAKNGFYHKIILEKDGTTSSTYGRTYHQYVIRFSRINYEH